MTVEAQASRELTPLAVEWLAMLPPVLQEDPGIQAVLGALAREAERLIERARLVGEGLVPTQANEYTLPLWEALLGLPVNPPGTPISTRQNLVVSRLVRGEGGGAQWEQALARASGNSARYAEYDSGDPDAPRYTLIIDTALPRGMTAEALRSYLRQVAPANLHLEIRGGQTYQQIKDRHATYQEARDAYLNYENMRYGEA